MNETTAPTLYWSQLKYDSCGKESTKYDEFRSKQELIDFYEEKFEEDIKEDGPIELEIFSYFYEVDGETVKFSSETIELEKDNYPNPQILDCFTQGVQTGK